MGTDIALDEYQRKGLRLCLRRWRLCTTFPRSGARIARLDFLHGQVLPDRIPVEEIDRHDE
jgi:hypothetical protein